MRIATATALALAFILAAGAASAQSVLERGNGADPATLDPQKATTAAEANILRDLYEGLVSYDASGRLIPGAAESWTISDDGLTYSFALREAAWSDGSVVTADDFVRAFRRLLHPATEAPDASLFLSIDGGPELLAGDVAPDQLGVRAVDEATLEITLSRPDPLLLHLLALPAAMPIHRDAATVSAIPSVTGRFNGAYRFDGFSPGEGLWLVRNDDFRDAANVAYDTVVYRGLTAASAMTAFSDGSIAISSAVPAFALAEIAEEMGDELREARYAGTFILAANVDGVLADRSLRRAVALGVDRVALADETWIGLMIPTLAIVPDGVADLGAPAEADLGPNDPDARQAEARALLASAGFTDEAPLELTLAVSEGGLSLATAEAIAGDLAEIGIVAEIVVRRADTHNSRLLGERDFDLATVGWIGRVGQVEEFLVLFETGPLNLSGYTDADLDGWIAEARRTADRTVRTALYAAADRIVASDLPAIPLMHYASFNLVSSDLAGWIDNPIDVHLSRWLAPAETGEEPAQ